VAQALCRARDFPHALDELALLHERGNHNVVFVDYVYSAGQAAELGYVPSLTALASVTNMERWDVRSIRCCPSTMTILPVSRMIAMLALR
jgi:hypothetical protein